MDYSFSELFDLAAVEALLQSLRQETGWPAGILDVDGRMLAGGGWQEICTRFHRQHPEESRHCLDCAGRLGQVLENEEYLPELENTACICPHGLITIAMPIVIDGRHLATLSLGQFLRQPADESQLREQAGRLGVSAEEYLEAWRRVPVFDPERLRLIIAFHRCCVHLLEQMGEDRLGRRKIEKQVQDREQRLRRQNAELLRLGNLRGISFGQFAAVAREILEVTARVLEVERVSLWLYNRERTRLRCFDQFEHSRRRHSRGQELQTSQYPAYFNFIEQEPNLVANDVRNDPRTGDLWDSYLLPVGISSMLDTPIWSGGRMVGILCCEHVGAPRRWSYDEQNFAGSAADFLSLAREERDHRRAEAGLRESEEKYRLLFTSESDAILIFDVETRHILEANPAATRLYGYSREEFAKLGIDHISAEPRHSHVRIDRMLSGHLSHVPLSHHRRRDGSVFPVEISSGSFIWKGRRRFVAIVRDITEREKAAQMKEEVLSVVSHEMRTPLTAMIGFTEFLLKNEVRETQRSEYLQIIRQEGERLQDLTDNLLDLQRLRAGVETENFQPVEVFPLLSSAASLFSKASASHNIVLDCPQDLPPAWGDEKQLYRSLQNLLSNAIKYSPRGGEITLGARRDNGFALIWVRDRGIGIPRKAQDHIFERFSRGSSVAVKKIGGTGLGLALVRAVAENHRGRVWVESAAGKGSTFYLAIPLQGDGGQNGVRTGRRRKDEGG